MPRFRPPKLPKSLQALEGPFAALYEDLQALIRAPGDVAIRSTTYRASPGETVRVSPPPEGMGLVLPPPSADNRGAEITVLIEKPAGELRVFVSQDGPAGPSGAPTLDGEEMAVYSTEGALRFKSNGATRWCDARGAAGAAGATGATGATGAAGADAAFALIRTEVFKSNGDVDEYDADDNLVSTTTSSTWTIRSDGNVFRVWVVPSGSSGGSGSRNTTASNTGGSGAGGPRVGDGFFDRATMGAQSPATVVVGTAPAAATGLAAARTAVAGNNGNTGNTSRFGTLLSGYSGGGGGGGLNTGGNRGGGTGGGSLGAGSTPAAGSTGTGGAPATDADKHGIGGAGAGSASTGLAGGIGQPGRAAEDGGGAGGGVSPVGGGASSKGGAGGNAISGGPGSGGGGAAQSGTGRGGGGNAGGFGARSDGSLSGNGATGPNLAAGDGNGTDGTDGANGDVLACILGKPGTGGQACLISAGATSFTSGRGGHGGFPGGSSGGSGGGHVAGGTGNLTIADSGTPAAGVVVVKTYG